MHSTHCVLSVIKEKIFHLLPLSAKPQLEKAIKLSKQYDETWHSIFWNTSKAAVKHRVRSQLKRIAFDTYTAMLNLAKALNTYANSQTTKQPQWWTWLHSNLARAFEYINQEHSHQIYSQQLELPLYENVPNRIRNNTQCDGNLAGNTRPRSQGKTSEMAA